MRAASGRIALGKEGSDKKLEPGLNSFFASACGKEDQWQQLRRKAGNSDCISFRSLGGTVKLIFVIFTPKGCVRKHQERMEVRREGEIVLLVTQ